MTPRPLLSGLAVAVALFGNSRTAQAQWDDAANLRREIEQTKATIEALQRHLSELETRLQRLTSRDAEPGDAARRLLFPIDIERAMLHEGYSRQWPLPGETPGSRSQRFEFRLTPLSPTPR